MLVDELLFEAWAKEYPEDAKQIVERNNNMQREAIKRRLDALKTMREEKEKVV